MKLSDVYIDGYCNGDRVPDKLVLEALEHYKQTADKLVVMGPAFTIAFKEANKIYMWLEDIACARGLK